MSTRVIVLDDDVEIRALLQRFLTEQGLTVRAVEDATQLDRLLQREHFDLLVLDLMMPGEDGMSICRSLRQQGETIPIIMLTAKGDPVDRILGLEMGADDYLAKPFNARELLARIHALLRRQAISAAGTANGRLDTLHFGPFALDLSRRELSRHGETLELTSTEFALLKALASNPHRPLGRDRLIELAKGRDHEVGEGSISVQVLRLRRLIEADAANPKYIQTVWGVGYVFVPDQAA